MSPSLGPINQNIICTSDYFLVPMAPDYFSVMAIEFSCLNTSEMAEMGEYSTKDESSEGGNISSS